MRLRQTAPKLLTWYALAFGLVLVQVAYWQFVRGEELANHQRNPRYWDRVRQAERGRILAADGTPLAVSEPVAASSRRQAFKRRYPGGATYAHIIGYSHERIGEAGIELALNGRLSGLTGPPPAPAGFMDLLDPPRARGADVELSIDPTLQELAVRELGGRRGAVVVIEVATGAVLALADNPRYDPNQVIEQWEALNSDEARPLLARAYQGRYPPGSVFKVLTAAAAIDAGIPATGRTWHCEGTTRLADSRVVCLKRSGHGDLDLTAAMAKSCNIVLAKVALEVGRSRYLAALERLGMDRRYALFRPGFDSTGVVARGSYPSGEAMTGPMLAACGYGQGALAVTPLQVAALGQTLANGGRLIEPWLVRRVIALDGTGVWERRREPGEMVCSGAAAASVLQMMRAVMQPGGTAAGLRVSKLDAAAKTGSAENPHGEAHGWFLAVAPAAAPQVVVAVVIEHGGSGSGSAGPVAMTLLRRALDRVR